MSQLEIQILHQDYVLTCPDGQEAQLLEAVERVDQQFQHMRESGKLRSRERVGVLLAVNLAYENLELRKQLQTLQQQVGQHSDAAFDADLADDTAERLSALEAQAAYDQAQAQALLQRLDQALACGPTSDTLSEADAVLDLAGPDVVADVDAAAASSFSGLDAPLSQPDISALCKDGVLDTDGHKDLPVTPSETL